jgi:hypothetical protein
MTPHSELVVKLTPDVEYGYGDNRDIHGAEKRFGEAIMIFFQPVPDEGFDFDYIILAAVK